eukprot:CAMPEP_0172494170 /NCGR_PEP_ID=MMETSP1066-20121228/39658_1 /TAXON_ID=671091 /ORGANISM="Coscinodiscus wailesii, Strain CCMP2513" /LENGTH=77 /DNA_ID=CAMNT_0013264913 /DNA_START=192 /DNA_END=421 /DNA_ORIENTATION=-
MPTKAEVSMPTQANVTTDGIMPTEAVAINKDASTDDLTAAVTTDDDATPSVTSPMFANVHSNKAANDAQKARPPPEP